jgi:putative peptidoglycan lipid II flippase
MPEAHKHTSTSVLRGTSIVSSFTLISRLLGFVRDLLTARLFGASGIADAFFVAFRIPNLLRSLVAEGALTSAFVPVFSGELVKGKDTAQQTLRAVSGLLLQTTTFITALGIIFAPSVVELLAPGFANNPGKMSLCVELTRIMFPYIMCVSLVSMIDGTLNSMRIFGTSAMAQVVMNLVLILGAIIAGWFESYGAVIALSWSVVAGGLIQILVQLPRLRRAGLSLLPTRHIFTPATRQLLKLMLPAVFGAAIYQVSIFLNTLLASLVSDGAVSWLYYADRIAQLPIGIFSIALASVLLPTLSRSAATRNHSEFMKSLADALRFTSFVIIPVAIGLFFYAEIFVRIVFQRGQFSAQATRMTALALQGLALGLWGISCQSMTARAFIARKDIKTPTILGMFTLCIGIGLSLTLMGKIQQPGHDALSQSLVYLQDRLLNVFPSPNLGHVGLAVSTGFAATLSFALLSVLLSRRLETFNLRTFVHSSLKCLIAGCAMYGALLLIDPVFSSTWLKLAAGTLGGGLAYISVLFLLKSTELQETFRIISR